MDYENYRALCDFFFFVSRKYTHYNGCLLTDCAVLFQSKKIKNTIKSEVQTFNIYSEKINKKKNLERLSLKGSLNKKGINRYWGSISSCCVLLGGSRLKPFFWEVFQIPQAVHFFHFPENKHTNCTDRNLCVRNNPSINICGCF